VVRGTLKKVWLMMIFFKYDRKRMMLRKRCLIRTYSFTEACLGVERCACRRRRRRRFIATHDVSVYTQAQSFWRA
jgi:hypothetical protein